MSELVLKKLTRKEFSANIVKILNVLNDAFHDEYLFKEELLYWKYLMGENELLCYAAFKDDEIVGIRFNFVFDVEENGRTISIVQPSDSAVIRSEQGKGIFGKLTRFFIDDIKTLHRPFVVLNFPNEKSKPTYVKLGWDISERHWYMSHTFALQTPLSSIQKLNEIHLKELPSLFCWRFFQHPCNDYFFYENNKAKFIFKVEKYYGFKLCRVMYYESSDEIHMSESIHDFRSALFRNKIFCLTYLDNDARFLDSISARTLSFKRKNKVNFCNAPSLSTTTLDSSIQLYFMDFL
ncbi:MULTISPECIES: GNAT family N-acetyltransferase [Vibrio]|uniref:GNAT family N-acetyltransferase n=1 Tax=Vibrio TaxID=662 RepID=UPI00215C5B89|nr:MULTISPECIES: GNAT family N-acetyltransferase [Vibrio]MCR9533325.1 GNAT family N-acetyltransferase [Vibrio alginolyticus]MDW2067529.1 GNAT family N-acetyltransferase [Vibrio sp. 1579]